MDINCFIDNNFSEFIFIFSYDEWFGEWDKINVKPVCGGVIMRDFIFVVLVVEVLLLYFMLNEN